LRACWGTSAGGNSCSKEKKHKPGGSKPEKERTATGRERGGLIMHAGPETWKKRNASGTVPNEKGRKGNGKQQKRGPTLAALGPQFKKRHEEGISDPRIGGIREKRQKRGQKVTTYDRGRHARWNDVGAASWLIGGGEREKGVRDCLRRSHRPSLDKETRVGNRGGNKKQKKGTMGRGDAYLRGEPPPPRREKKRANSDKHGNPLKEETNGTKKKKKQSGELSGHEVGHQHGKKPKHNNRKQTKKQKPKKKRNTGLVLRPPTPQGATTSRNNQCAKGGRQAPREREVSEGRNITYRRGR